MSEPIPCPSCQALLRLPAGAATVRCPNCQTILAIEPADAPLPPPPPPVAKAAPLPFGRAATAAPSADTTPKPARTAPAKRAKLVTDDAYDGPPPEGETDEEARVRAVRRELREMDEKEEKEAELFNTLEGHCRTGRIAMHLLTWAVRGYGLAVMFQFLSVITAGFMMYDYAALLGLVCLAFSGLTTVLFCVGFGFVLGGPEGGRYLGAMGLVACILHAIGGLLQPSNLAITAVFQGLDPQNRGLWAEYLPVQDILGIATNFPLLADQPTRLFRGYNYSIPGMVVAALEVTRLVLFALLTQNYAVGGKEQELGHRAFKTVSRMFWVVFLTASLRLAVSALFDWSNDDIWFKIGMAAHGALTFACYLSLGLSLLLHSQMMTETTEVVDHRRYIDKRDRLDVV